MGHHTELNRTFFLKDVVVQDTVVTPQDTIVQEIRSDDAIHIPSDTVSEIIPAEQPVQDTENTVVIIPDPVVRPQPVIREQIPSPSVTDPGPMPDNSRFEFIQDKLKESNYLNFLKKTDDQFFYVEDSARLVYSDTSSDNFYATELSDQSSIASLKTEQLIKPDWLIGIIIGCLVLFAWLKLFYNKFIDQTFISLWNFRLSENFQRDQSIFSRRVAMLLNFNFIITSGLFFYLVAVYFELNPWSLSPFKIFLASSGMVALLLAARFIITHLSGAVFDYHKLYKDYLNQILITYKVAGIVLIPLIMIIAYIPDNYRIYLIIMGLILLVSSVLLRFVKGIQLIFKKDVSIFYLILYLCTLEFLPALVIYKFFSSLV